MYHLCYLCLVFGTLSRMFIAALWSPEGKGLTSWLFFYVYCFPFKVVSEYDQEIPQLQTADNPMALGGRATQPSRDTRKTN